MDLNFPPMDGSRKCWRVNGITYYWRNGQLICRTSKNEKRTSRKDENGKELPLRSPAQEKSSSVFSEAQAMTKAYFLAHGHLLIWVVAPKTKPGQSSWALHRHLNKAAYIPDEGVRYFNSYRFSHGILEFPDNFTVRREGWHITLEWEDDRDQPAAAAGDLLFVGYFHEGYPRSPLLVPVTGATRGEQRAEFDIPPLDQPDGGALHLYPFFGRADKSAYAGSYYMRC